MSSLVFIDDSFIEKNSDFNQLIECLNSDFATATIHVPQRHHHDYANPSAGTDSTLLLMPAFNPGHEAGVKMITINPDNAKQQLPSIQGIYVLMDANTGNIKAVLDAKSLTAKRTAATSALASKFLAREESSSLLMIGTGLLAGNLIRAHAMVRPLRQVFVWGRSMDKAQAVCDALAEESYRCTAIATLEPFISKVDIISCATLSPTPLVLGENLVPGQHVDLVGSYQPTTREADDSVIRRSSVFLDTYQGGLTESGDIRIPLDTGVISASDIKADLYELCGGTKQGRSFQNEITCFKSVGHALEDLSAATYFYNLYNTTNV
ncbi:MAG: ornithine cyclodeaminase family protein [Arenimonas sp.]|nr:ornithine cyclodeaminase family protein [Arenimonas sp.]